MIPAILFLAVPQCPLNLPVGIPLRHAVALVVQLLAAAKAQGHLHPPVLQVQIQRHQGISLLHHRGIQLPDFGLVQQELLHAERIPVKLVTLFIGADVHSFGPDFAVMNPDPALLQVHLSLANAFDLCSEQNEAALVLFLHKIIVVRLAVLRNDLNPLLMRHRRFLQTGSIVACFGRLFNWKQF